MSTLHLQRAPAAADERAPRRDAIARVVERVNRFVEIHADAGVVDPDRLRERAIVDTLRSIVGDGVFDPADGWASPLDPDSNAPLECDPGAAYEALLGMELVESDTDDPMLVPRRKGARARAGAFYTPPALVEHVLDQALDPLIEDRAAQGIDALLSIRVCDPACGSGRFLIAAAHRIGARVAQLSGEDPDEAVARAVDRCCYGVDLDPIAAELCVAALVDAGGSIDRIREHVRVGNALLGAIDPEITRGGIAPCDAWCAEHLGANPEPRDALFHWGIAFPEVCGPDATGFDVVVGNPPFLNQLSSATATQRRTAALLRACCAGAVGGYADLAVAFLVRSLLLCADRGRVSLVLPQSFLVSDDARAARSFVLEHGSLDSIWVSNEHVFEDAGVYTCAPTFLKGGERTAALTRTSTGAFKSHDPIMLDNDALREEPTWGRIGAGTIGVPDVVVRREHAISDLAHATADFRDQYYGLKGHLLNDADIEDPGGEIDARYPRLLTSGLIDPARSLWEERRTRVHKVSWMSPRIDRASLACDAAMSGWIERRLVPKILLATQTRVIELVVDEEGVYVPGVPVITVVPKDPDDLWRVAAALGSPVSTMLALRDHFGAAMSIGALKLSAKHALRLPVVRRGAALEEAADRLRAAHGASDDDERREYLLAYARACRGFAGLSARDSERVESWWIGRLTGQPGGGDS
jgi:SAM-dependent methyltransferase